MFCKNCGSQIDDRAVVCPNCGTPTENYAPQTGKTNSADSRSAGFAVLCFFFPVVGLILYLYGRTRCRCAQNRAGKAHL